MINKPSKKGLKLNPLNIIGGILILIGLPDVINTFIIQFTKQSNTHIVGLASLLPWSFFLAGLIMVWKGSKISKIKQSVSPQQSSQSIQPNEKQKLPSFLYVLPWLIGFSPLILAIIFRIINFETEATGWSMVIYMLFLLPIILILCALSLRSKDLSKLLLVSTINVLLVLPFFWLLITAL